MAYCVRSCVLCGSRSISAVWDTERIVIVSCTACASVVRIEFDPEDAPNVRGRIEPLFTPDSSTEGVDDDAQ